MNSFPYHMFFRRFLCLAVWIILFASCGTQNKAYYKHASDGMAPELPVKKVEHRLYLIGDAGGLDDYQTSENYVFNFAKNRMVADSAEKSLVFLGDNIYHDGLQAEGHPDRKREEAILDAHIDLATSTNADAYFIPGNHDWNDGEKGGLECILRQEQYIDRKGMTKDGKQDRMNFYPNSGCGDPKVIKVNKDLVFVMMNSQWWVSDWSEEPEINNGCEIQSRREFLDRMQDIIVQYKNDKIVLILHHPMISNGNHGGKFSLGKHLFPAGSLPIPLPIIRMSLII